MNAARTSKRNNILILDDDAGLTHIMSLLFNEQGIFCTVRHSLEELKEQRDGVFQCDTAILDINLGSGHPSGLDAYRWLIAQKFPGKIIFFTGNPDFHPLVREAEALGARVIGKPNDVSEIIAMIRVELMNEEALSS